MPTLLLPRGQSLAPVKVATASGEVLSPLASREAKLRLGQVVHHAVLRRLVALQRDVDEAAATRVALFLRGVVTRPAKEAESLYQSVFGSEEPSAAFHAGVGTAELPLLNLLREDKDESLRRLLRVLARNYFLMVDYLGRPGDRLMLSCSFTRPLIERDQQNLRRDAIRRLVGTDSYRFRFPLALALRTRSYQALRISGWWRGGRECGE